MLSRKNRGKLLRQLRDYGIITIAMLLGVIGVNLFLLSNEITTGGLMGIILHCQAQRVELYLRTDKRNRS